MVAKITTGKSIRGMLLYNENKVLQGEAKLILSSGFAIDIDQLNFQQKLQRFQHLTELKPNVKTNALHISLNFHHSEKLDNHKLQQIARIYMEKIGFGDQPYLVYRHDDAAHQHLHITTTNITSEARRIDLHDIGKKLSEPARKALEMEYRLVKAEDQGKEQAAGIRAAELKGVKYGTLPTKQAIRNVVTAVTRDYRYTSLAEYNAALKCFNVVALRGAEHTAMFQRRGLMFSVLDQRGKPVGVPIKASALYGKPTLKNLERKFAGNIEKRKDYKEELKSRIDRILENPKVSSLKTLEKAANREHIQLSFRQNDQGLMYGITYVDHKNKVVFNGSDLGKAYSAKAVTGRLQSKKNILNQAEVQKVGRSATYRADKAMPPEFNLRPRVLDLALAKQQDEPVMKIPRRKKRRRKNQIIQQEINL